MTLFATKPIQNIAFNLLDFIFQNLRDTIKSKWQFKRSQSQKMAKSLTKSILSLMKLSFVLNLFHLIVKERLNEWQDALSPNHLTTSNIGPQCPLPPHPCAKVLDAPKAKRQNWVWRQEERSFNTWQTFD